MRVLLIVLALIVAAVRAQEPLYQGRTLRQWLAGPQQGACEAMAALGPGGPLADEALQFLIEQLPARNGNAVAALMVFGQRGFAAIAAHGQDLYDRRGTVRTLCSAGAPGVEAAVELVAAAAAGDRAAWLQGFAETGPPTVLAIARSLEGRPERTDVLLACLEACKRIPVEVLPRLRSCFAEATRMARVAAVAARVPPARLGDLTAFAGSLTVAGRAAIWTAIERDLERWCVLDADLPALREALRTGDARVQRPALALIGRIGARARCLEPELLELLAPAGDGEPFLRVAAFSALCHLGPWSPEAAAAAQQWIAMARGLRHDDLWSDFVGCLAPVGVGAVPLLCEALAQGRELVQQSAAVALARIGPEAREALPELQALLSRPELGAVAAKALVAIAPERWDMIEPAVLALAGKEPRGPMQERDATILLLEHGRPRPEVLSFFVQHQGEWRQHIGERAQRRLLQAGWLQPLAETCTRGMLFLDPADFLQEVRKHGDLLLPVVPALRRKIEQQVAVACQVGLGSGCGNGPWDSPNYLECGRLLGIAGPAQLALLADWLHRGNGLLRSAARAGLGELATTQPKARQLLLGCLRDLQEDPELQDLASVLASGGPDTARALAMMLNELSPARTLVALSALSTMGKDATPALAWVEPLVDSSDTRVRNRAFQLLCRHPSLDPVGPERIPALMARLESNQEPTERDSLAFVRLREECGSELLHAVLRSRPDIRRWVVVVWDAPGLGPWLRWLRCLFDQDPQVRALARSRFIKAHD